MVEVHWTSTFHSSSHHHQISNLTGKHTGGRPLAAWSRSNDANYVNKCAFACIDICSLTCERTKRHPCDELGRVYFSLIRIHFHISNGMNCSEYRNAVNRFVLYWHAFFCRKLIQLIGPCMSMVLMWKWWNHILLAPPPLQLLPPSRV